LLVLLCDSTACTDFRRVHDAASVFVAIRCGGDGVLAI